MSAVTVNGRRYDEYMIVGLERGVLHRRRESNGDLRCASRKMRGAQWLRDAMDGASPVFCSRCFPADGGETR